MSLPAGMAGAIAAILVNMQSVRVDCGDRDVVDCLCTAGVYRTLDEQLRDTSFRLTRRRINAYALPRACMPVVESEELVLYNDQPVVRLSIAKRYNARMRRIEVDVDVLEVYDGEVKRWLCRAFPNSTACRGQSATTTLAQFMP